MKTHVLSEPEKEAIRTVIGIARRYGYGNMIGWLKWAWAKHLKEKYGGTWKQHVKAADTDVYPEHWNFEEM